MHTLYSLLLQLANKVNGRKLNQDRSCFLLIFTCFGLQLNNSIPNSSQFSFKQVVIGCDLERLADQAAELQYQ